jgi:hypothetical protein
MGSRLVELTLRDVLVTSSVPNDGLHGSYSGVSLGEQLKGVVLSLERKGRACESLPRWAGVRIL